MKMKYGTVRETIHMHTLLGVTESFGILNFCKRCEKKIPLFFNAFDQEKTSSEIRQKPKGFLSKEHEDNGVDLTDEDCFSFCFSPTTHLLINADVAEKLMTGRING